MGVGISVLIYMIARVQNTSIPRRPSHPEKRPRVPSEMLKGWANVMLDTPRSSVAILYSWVSVLYRHVCNDPRRQ